MTNRVLLSRLVTHLHLQNSTLKAEGSKTWIYYNASFLPGYSLIFSIPMLSKLEVNDESGNVSQFNLTDKYLERKLIKPAQINILFEIGWTNFWRNYGIAVLLVFLLHSVSVHSLRIIL